MNDFQEIIKPIQDYDGYYISNLGIVYCDLGKGCRTDKNYTKSEMYIIQPRKLKMDIVEYMQDKHLLIKEKIYIFID